MLNRLKRLICPGIFALLVLAITVTAEAGQSFFQAGPTGHMLQFNYRYKNYNDGIEELFFLLNRKAVNLAQNQFYPFDNGEMQDYVIEYLRGQANSIPGVEIEIRHNGGDISFHAQGRSQEQVQAALDKMRLYSENAQDQYIASRYFIKDTSGKYVMPDHMRIAQESAASMRPVGKALAQNMTRRTPRDYVNAALNFLQSIPYDTLQDRAHSNGAGFAPPLAMLAINRGDCDTKSVALIALMKTMQPQIPAVLVYTTNHAFVGFALATESGDRILTIEGRAYVLAEPAGPGLYPLGKIARESIADLDKGNFSYVPIR